MSLDRRPVASSKIFYKLGSIISNHSLTSIALSCLLVSTCGIGFKYSYFIRRHNPGEGASEATTQDAYLPRDAPSRKETALYSTLFPADPDAYAGKAAIGWVQYVSIMCNVAPVQTERENANIARENRSNIKKATNENQNEMSKRNKGGNDYRRRLKTLSGQQDFQKAKSQNTIIVGQNLTNKMKTSNGNSSRNYAITYAPSNRGNAAVNPKRLNVPFTAKVTHLRHKIPATVSSNIYQKITQQGPTFSSWRPTDKRITLPKHANHKNFNQRNQQTENLHRLAPRNQFNPSRGNQHKLLGNHNAETQYRQNKSNNLATEHDSLLNALPSLNLNYGPSKFTPRSSAGRKLSPGVALTQIKTDNGEEHWNIRPKRSARETTVEANDGDPAEIRQFLRENILQPNYLDALKELDTTIASAKSPIIAEYKHPIYAIVHRFLDFPPLKSRGDHNNRENIYSANKKINRTQIVRYSDLCYRWKGECLGYSHVLRSLSEVLKIGGKLDYPFGNGIPYGNLIGDKFLIIPGGDEENPHFIKSENSPEPSTINHANLEPLTWNKSSVKHQIGARHIILTYLLRSSNGSQSLRSQGYQWEDAFIQYFQTNFRPRHPELQCVVVNSRSLIHGFGAASQSVIRLFGLSYCLLAAFVLICGLINKQVWSHSYGNEDGNNCGRYIRPAKDTYRGNRFGNSESYKHQANSNHSSAPSYFETPNKFNRNYCDYDTGIARIMTPRPNFPSSSSSQETNKSSLANCCSSKKSCCRNYAWVWITTVHCVGLFTPQLGIFAAIGVFSLFDIPYDGFTEVMPFLVLAVGIDDMFIIVSSWNAAHRTESWLASHYDVTATRLLSRALSHSGVAVSVTSATNALTFGIGALSGIEAVRRFCAYSAAAFIFTWALQLSFFSAWLRILMPISQRCSHDGTRLFYWLGICNKDQSSRFRNSRSTGFDSRYLRPQVSLACLNNSYDKVETEHGRNSYTGLYRRRYSDIPNEQTAVSHVKHYSIAEERSVQAGRRTSNFSEPIMESELSKMSATPRPHSSAGGLLAEGPPLHASARARSASIDLGPAMRLTYFTSPMISSLVNSSSDNLTTSTTGSHNGSSQFLIPRVSHSGVSHQGLRRTVFPSSEDNSSRYISSGDNSRNISSSDSGSPASTITFLHGKTKYIADNVKNYTYHRTRIFKSKSRLFCFHKMKTHIQKNLVWNKGVKAVVLLASLIYAVVAIMAILNAKIGMNVYDLVPANHPYAVYSRRNLEVFQNDGGAQLVVIVMNPPSLSQQKIRNDLHRLVATFEALPWVVSAARSSFIDEYEAYVRERRWSKALEVTWRGRLKDWLKSNATVEYQWAETIAWRPAMQHEFNNCIKEERSYDNSCKPVIAALQLRFTLQDFGRLPQQVAAAKVFRATAAAASPALNVTVFNSAFAFVDQQNEVGRTLVTALLAVAAIMTLTMAVVYRSVRLVTAILSVLASVCVGVVGAATLWGVHIDCVSMIAFIIAIGFSVDYLVHMADGYSGAQKPSPDEKAAHAVRHMGWPVLKGAATTILGVAPLGLSSIYSVQVFYKTVFLVVILGFTHAVFVLPSLLCLMDKGVAKFRNRLKRRRPLRFQ